ncbi:hypothetical protein BKA69DRAFT_1129149 [Paraphysoderma sedebokerense]|nr:hypothetical protein BKA69DRAFT_1129149 [Paraphysoderma sedebokerense]
MKNYIVWLALFGMLLSVRFSTCQDADACSDAYKEYLKSKCTQDFEAALAKLDSANSTAEFVSTVSTLNSLLCIAQDNQACSTTLNTSMQMVIRQCVTQIATSTQPQKLGSIPLYNAIRAYHFLATQEIACYRPNSDPNTTCLLQLLTPMYNSPSKNEYLVKHVLTYFEVQEGPEDTRKRFSSMEYFFGEPMSGNKSELGCTECGKQYVRKWLRFIRKSYPVFFKSIYKTKFVQASIGADIERISNEAGNYFKRLSCFKDVQLNEGRDELPGFMAIPQEEDFVNTNVTNGGDGVVLFKNGLFLMVGLMALMIFGVH